ncbi:MAG: RNA methyltransferase [Calditrichaeota bacterium]|nr:RNA methyltransferase [Calditrichota bacterium]
MKSIERKNVIFILVEPQYPGNIGSAARALKTMGFSRLRLVNPADPNAPQARWMAHASEEILEAAEIFPDLQSALKDVHFAVATTQREREFHFPFYTPKQLAAKIADLSREHHVALVFGREQSGLTNEEISYCHAISTIPAAVSHPSLNLAQAVMVYAYELFNFEMESEKSYSWRLASQPELTALYDRLQQSLRRVGFQPMDDWDSFMMRFKRMFGRLPPEVRDVRLMHKILHAFDVYIDQLEKKAKEKDKS